jgi:RNA polymerase sigma factor (TIGR02999 family)
MSVPVSPDAPDSSAGRHAIDDLFTHTYQELRRIAASIRRRDARATIDPTALVNEAWMKLAAGRAVSPESHLHFKRLAARAMRQVLVEAARRRLADKRGGGALLVTFDESLLPADAGVADLLALDAALETLASVSPRQAALIECRFFGGLDAAETAAVLSISEATVLRDWRAARAWLAAEIRRHGRSSTD